MAISINPITILSPVEKPKKTPAITPSIRGKITPPVATKEADFFTFFNLDILVSSPDMKSKNNIPISASKANSTEPKSNWGSGSLKL